MSRIPEFPKQKNFESLIVLKARARPIWTQSVILLCASEDGEKIRGGLMKKDVCSFAVLVLSFPLIFILLMAVLYSTLCYVEGDLSRVPKPGKYSHHIHDLFYEVKFDLILSLGLTEFKAFIAWEENVRYFSCLFPLYWMRFLQMQGKEKRSSGQSDLWFLLLICVAFHSGVQLRSYTILIHLSSIRHPWFERLIQFPIYRRGLNLLVDIGCQRTSCIVFSHPMSSVYYTQPNQFTFPGTKKSATDSRTYIKTSAIYRWMGTEERGRILYVQVISNTIMIYWREGGPWKWKLKDRYDTEHTHPDSCTIALNLISWAIYSSCTGVPHHQKRACFSLRSLIISKLKKSRLGKPRDCKFIGFLGTDSIPFLPASKWMPYS